MGGYVTHQDAAEAAVEPGDTAAARVTVDARCGCEHLEQRVIAFAPGRSKPRRLEGREGALYVVSGRGALEHGGARHELEPDTGVYVAPGEEYVVDVPGPDELVLVAVDAPAPEGGAAGEGRKVTLHWRDQPPLPASGGREFRYMVTPEVGCRDLTQFVGEIPPGRAPDHSHSYDEIVYVLEGEGVLHLDGHDDTPLRAGSCIHLPPLQVHCLENVGTTTMRVLGVFHPAGDPASRAYEGGS